MKKTWKIDSVHPKLKTLIKELNISKTTAQILANRGFDVETGKKFLRASLSDLHDPFLMKHMKTIVQRIHNAVKNKEKIMIYGDYDVDGMTSTAILMKILKQLGLEVFYYIPNRLIEDYGLGKKGVDHAKRKNASLIITVDCGINAKKEIKYAKDKGLDVIITDHHEIENGLPDVPFLNPKGDNYPFKSLAGAGVVLKLVQALMQKNNLKNFDNYIEIASVGTVTDVVPLLDENRIIVKNGLVFLEHSVNLGLDALKKYPELKR